MRKEILAEGIELYLSDCLKIFPVINKVDAVISDPPFGTTQCSWDAIIPFAEMWNGLRGVCRESTPIIIFGCEPFSSFLRTSNLKNFKYDWIWDKPKGTGFLNAKKRPLRSHEIISVFCEGTPPYFPQKTKGHARKQTFRGKHLQTDVYGKMAGDYHYDSTERYPRSVITFSSDTQNSSIHPTQKPVSLMEYLVATYTKEGETVLDFTMGSGTTGVSCVKLNRKFIGIEKDPEYFEAALARISDAIKQDDFFRRGMRTP